MTIEQELYTRLTADTTLMSQITALYWRQAPARDESGNPVSLPYVTYFQVDDPRTKELLSYYGGEARVQFSIFDESASNGLASSEALIEAVKSLRGKSNGLRIHGQVVNVLSQPANIDGIYHRTVDVVIRYTEET